MKLNRDAIAATERAITATQKRLRELQEELRCREEQEAWEIAYRTKYWADYQARRARYACPPPVTEHRESWV